MLIYNNGRFDYLPKRESGIAVLAERGLSSKEIGVELGLTHATVRMYMSRIYVKLDLTGLPVSRGGRTALAKLVRESRYE